MTGMFKRIASIFLVIGIIALLFVNTAAALKNAGDYIGEYKGVIAYSNGGNTGTPYGDLAYQCVGYVKRFYSTLMDTSQWYGFDAIDYYNRASERGLIAYPNNGYMQPHPDDILVFSGGTTYGHVAIITEVGTNYIKIIEQNVNRESAYATLPRYGNYIPNRNIGGATLSPKGWVRKSAPITVYSPDGGEYWQKTSPYNTIRWDFSGYSGTSVQINLYKGYSPYPIYITTSPIPIGGNGKGSYTLPGWLLSSKGVVPGNDYWIKVTTNYGYWDGSNRYFTIQ